MVKPIDFNSALSTVMHVDLNSCFATIEQQANPYLRGKPIAVAAYTTGNGCIVAPSVEAKRLGIKVGMRVKDGLAICPTLVILAPDPDKYRFVHQGLRRILSDYTDKIIPKSIDEFVLEITGLDMWQTGREIKARIKTEIGEWLTVSVGIGPNRFLAKTAAGLHKPDGLNEINIANFAETYFRLKLTDLCGVKTANANRLNRMNIFTVLDFYQAEVATFFGYCWHRRLHGYEVDDVIWDRKSFGNSYAFYKQSADIADLIPILQKLVEKTGFRLRRAGFCARGVHVSLLYRDWQYWHHGQVGPVIFDSRDIYKRALQILNASPRLPVHTLAVSCFDIIKTDFVQGSLIEDLDKKRRLVEAVDKVNERWGNFVIAPATMMGTQKLVLDRISYNVIQ
jgi:DNA polymerase-4